MPMIKPSIKNIIEPVQPTAARALTPRNLPTIKVSTKENNCWKMFPASNGRVK